MKAFITGADGGIGTSIVEVFKEHNIEVITPSIKELNLLSSNEIREYVKKLPNVDILINCAGINNLASIDEMDEEKLQETIQVNLLSMAMLIKYLTPSMKKNHYGRIVNFASIWADFSKVRRIMYSISKAGVKGLTTSAAVELAEHNILVNAVAPGFVATPLTYKNNTPDQIKIFADALPIKRMAEPREIAELVYFLASEKNTFMTGQTIYIDGGFSCI